VSLLLPRLLLILRLSVSPTAAVPPLSENESDDCIRPQLLSGAMTLLLICVEKDPSLFSSVHILSAPSSPHSLVFLPADALPPRFSAGTLHIWSIGAT
jgi:hypothetical protein